MPRQTDKLEHYRALVALDEHRTVSAAAKALRCGQPLVSRRLAMFQKCPLPLVKHEGRNLIFTPRGRELLPSIRDYVRRHGQLESALQGSLMPPRLLVVGTGHFTAAYYLPRAVALMRSRHSDVKIQIRLLRGEERILATASGKLDLAIVTHDDGQIRSASRSAAQLTVEPLVSHPLVVAALRRSPFGRALEKLPDDRPISLRDVAHLPMHGLDRDSGVRQQLERDWKREKYKPPEFLYEGGDWMVAKAFALEGLAPVVLPRRMISAQDQFVVRALGGRFKLQDNLIYRDDHENDLIAIFRDLVREVANAEK